MGIVVRQSLKNTAVTLTGALLGAVFTLLASWVLPVNEWGVSRNLINQGLLLQSVLLLGSMSVVIAYVPRYATEPKKRHALLSISFLLPLLATLVFIVPYFLFKDTVVQKYQARDQPYLRMLYGWMPLLAVLSSYMTLLEAYMSSRMKVAKATFMREVVLRLFNLLLLLLFYLRYLSFESFVIGTVLVFVVPFGMLFYLCLNDPQFRFTTRWRVLSRSDIVEALKYAWYHMLTAVALSLMVLIDQLLLMPLSSNGSDNVAIYNDAVLFVSFMIVPYRAMVYAVFPKLNEAIIASDNVKLKELFRRASVNMLTVSLYMSAAILCVMPSVILFLPHAYQYVTPVVLILLIGRAADYLTGLNSEVIAITPRYKFNFRLTALLIVTVVVLDRILIPKYGLYGAAWVSSGVSIVFNGIKAAYLYRHTGLNPFTAKSGWLLAGAALITGSIWIIPRFLPPLLDIVARGTLVTAAFSGLVLLVRPSEDVSGLLAILSKKVGLKTGIR